jgi:hypothetical protein
MVMQIKFHVAGDLTMAISVEQVGQNSYAINCAQEEWVDIKKIMAFALENYFETSLEFVLPRRFINGKKEDTAYDYFIEINKKIQAMAEPPKAAHTHDYDTIMITIDHLLDRVILMPKWELPRARAEYLNKELQKPVKEFF